jgi:low affinity Fe/Cu permease
LNTPATGFERDTSFGSSVHTKQEDSMRKQSWYEQLSRIAAKTSGRSGTFAAACAVVGLWLASGPLYRYSDTWQLAINIATTIVTFLMFFLIQHTQNRDAEAMQTKLGELIRATKGAHNALLDLEELTEQQQDYFRDRYEALAHEAQQSLLQGETDTYSPELGT